MRVDEGKGRGGNSDSESSTTKKKKKKEGEKMAKELRRAVSVVVEVVVVSLRE